MFRHLGALVVGVAATSLVSAVATAQPSTGRSAGGWYATATYRQAALRELRDAYEARGYSDPGSGDLALGIAAEASGSRLRAGLGFDVSVSPKEGELADGTRAKLSRYGLAALIGFHVFESRSLSAFPWLGLGLDRRTIELDPTRPPVLGPELSQYTDRTRVARWTPLGQLGVGVDWLIPVTGVSELRARAQRTEDGVLLGLRAGWQMAIARGDWAREGEALGSSPDASFEGWMLRLQIGYGSVQSDGGPCTERCPTRAGSVATCNLDGCQYECQSGYGNCDGSSASGCETLLTSLDHCGVCGQRCDIPRGKASCALASCEVATCEIGWADCNSFANDGCETQLDSNVANCGQCGARCGAGQTCSRGECRPADHSPSSADPG